jgi:hypothetical protein
MAKLCKNELADINKVGSETLRKFAENELYSDEPNYLATISRLKIPFSNNELAELNKFIKTEHGKFIGDLAYKIAANRHINCHTTAYDITRAANTFASVLALFGLVHLPQVGMTQHVENSLCYPKVYGNIAHLTSYQVTGLHCWFDPKEPNYDQKFAEQFIRYYQQAYQNNLHQLFATSDVVILPPLDRETKDKKNLTPKLTTGNKKSITIYVHT